MSNQEEWKPVVPPFKSETIILDIIRSYPPEATKEKFQNLNIHCFDCVVAGQDSLHDVATLHNIDEDHLLSSLNEAFQSLEPLEEPWF